MTMDSDKKSVSVEADPAFLDEITGVLLPRIDSNDGTNLSVVKTDKLDATLARELNFANTSITMGRGLEKEKVLKEEMKEKVVEKGNIILDQDNELMMLGNEVKTLKVNLEKSEGEVKTLKEKVKTLEDKYDELLEFVKGLGFGEAL